MSDLENFKIMPQGLSVGDMCDLVDYLPGRTFDNLHEQEIPAWVGVSLAHEIAIARNIPADSLRDALAGCPALEAELDRITEEPADTAESLEAWAREIVENTGYLGEGVPAWLSRAIDYGKVAGDLILDYWPVRECEAIREVWNKRPGVKERLGPLAPMRFFLFLK